MGAPILQRYDRRQRPPQTSPSLLLIRSRSGTPAVTLPEKQAPSLSSSQRFRSKSNTTPRIRLNEENIDPAVNDIPSSGFSRLLRRGNERNSSTNNAKSATNSPSAWALSPGRRSPYEVAQEQPEPGRVKVKSDGGGGIGGLFRYFRQKKVPAAQQEEYHELRVLYNRMLQWRFLNARAEAAMAAMKKNAEVKMLNVWLRIYRMRNNLVEYRIEAGELKHEMKLYQILIPRMRFLNGWSKLQGKNLEAVGRLSRKLSAILSRVPLGQGLKGNVESLDDAMSAAMVVMDGIEETGAKFYQQVEKMLYLATELVSMLEHRNYCIQELEKIVPFLSSSVVE